MPISEDEFDYNRCQEPQSTMSKAELRKTHKPIMEKRRRARINHCLNEIKTLILEAMNKDPSRHTKLEKADILEMAVKYLQNFHRQQLAMAMATDPSVLRKFKTGFNECATEIDRYMGQSEGVDTAMRQRVTNHLQKCIGGIEQVAQFNFPGFSNMSVLSGSSMFANQPETSTTSGDQNNNPRIQIPQGIQLIPSRLPSGELALLVPNSSNLPYFPTAVTQNVQRPSAFAAVVPQAASKESPPSSPTDQEPRRETSPHGFRPVLPKQRTYTDDHQVPQISSSVPQTEIKSMKFPIHQYTDKDKVSESPKKLAEPLCIITNQSERYKQAQMKEDSANYEENVVQRGVKRKFHEMSHQQGLLAVAQADVYPQSSKVSASRSCEASTSTATHTSIIQPQSSTSKEKNQYTSSNQAQSSTVKEKSREDQQSSSKDNGGDMWRPW